MNLEEFKSESQVFILNWYLTTENTKKLQMQFSDLGMETYVINAHEEEHNNNLPNWVHINKENFMVGQYTKAKEIFNKTYFISVFGDVYDVDAELIIKRACYVFDKYECGVYAPNIDYMMWNFDKNKIPKLEEHLYEVKNPESLLSVIHKDIFKDIVLDAEKYKFGWGIDFLVYVLAKLQGKKVIRDYITTARHPYETNYSKEDATAEYWKYIDNLGGDLSSLVKQAIEDAYKELKHP